VTPYYRDGCELELDDCLGQTGDDPYVKHLPYDPDADLFESLLCVHLVPMDEDDLAWEAYLEDDDD